MRRFIHVMSFICFASSIAACAAEPQDERASSSDDALSEAECNRIVGAALDKSRTDCDAKATEADAKLAARGDLERGVVSALASFETEAARATGADGDAIRDAIAECSAIECSGSLRTPDVKAECTIERAFLRAACYVRNWPNIERTAAGADFSGPMANLKDAWERMQDGWFSLAQQEVSLRAQHAACAPYAGSDAQRFALDKTCRASCNEDDATNLGGIESGHNAACTPPGYEQVKDDIGQLVECGAMKRPWQSLGTVCECQEQRGCGQFAALAGSSERGKPCTTDGGEKGFQRVVWHTDAGSASLECR